MINYVVCDIFQSPARVLVNTVNTVGVMGKGIAKDFKQFYPDMFKRYQRICERKSFDVGNLWLYKTTNKWILNFPTKRHWRQPSDPEYIERGLAKFIEMYPVYGITSISFPMLGCGNGELDWESQVQPLMEQHLKGLPITVFVHLQDRQDSFVPEHRDRAAMREWLHGEPESLPFAEVWEDLCVRFRDSTRLYRLDTEEPYDVAVDETGEELTLYAQAGHTHHVPASLLKDLWQQLRQSGIVSSRYVPSDLGTTAGFIVPIVAELPYVSPVVIADEYGDVTNNNAIGLRLLPRARRIEPPLLETARTVEAELVLNDGSKV